MRRLRMLRLRLRSLVRGHRVEQELDDELRDHLERQIERHRAAGLTAADARAAALREFGNVALIQDQCRDTRGLTLIHDLARDTRHALRSFLRSPGFALIAVLTLALGIGANTAIFSLVNAVRADAIPYDDPDSLVWLSGVVRQPTQERRGASFPDYLDWRAQSASFVDLAAVDDQQMTLLHADEPERIRVEFVSEPYFSLLGVAPTHGRTFLPDEDRIAQPQPVVIISDRLLQRRFGADAQIVGNTIALGGGPFRTYTVIGVMPPGFRGLTDAAELWLPFSQWAPATTTGDRGARGFGVLGRLRPSVDLAAAQRELDGISRELERAYPDTNANRGVELSALHDEVFGSMRPALRLLMAAVALVLLIACANVANLLITRSAGRHRETAVRRALGAGRGRLIRQHVTESCVLTTLGAIVGLLFARLCVTLLLAWSPVTFPSFLSPALDARVAVFTIIVSLLCGVAVGLASGLQRDSSQLGQALKDAARAGSSRQSQRLRHAIMVAEMALAVVLLVAAGLMIRSVRNLVAVDPGFDPSSVLTIRLTIPRETAASAAPARPVAESRVVLDKIRSVPGVLAAGLGNDVPLGGGSSAIFFTVQGQPPRNAQDRPRAYQHRVSPDFFRALRIPFVSGRTFADAELTRTPTVAVVSEHLAKRFWPEGDPLGKRLQIGSDSLTIVGVVRDVKYRGLPENPNTDPDIYLPFGESNSQVVIAARTAVPPASLTAAVRAAIREIDRSIVVSGIAPMTDAVARWTAPSRFLLWLMSVFAAMALGLAALGIYGVVSYLVDQRTREIGVRMALGAGRRRVLALVARQSALPIAIGLSVGLISAVGVARVLRFLLYEVGPFDPLTLVAVSVLFAAVAALACCLPAYRAANVDPLVAIRVE